MIQLSTLIPAQAPGRVRAGPLAATGASSFALSLDALPGALRIELPVKAGPQGPAASRQAIAEAGKELPEALLASEGGEAETEAGAPADDEGPAAETDPRDPALTWLPAPIPPSLPPVPTAASASASASAPAAAAAPSVGGTAETSGAEVPRMPGAAQTPHPTIDATEAAATDRALAPDRPVLAAKDEAVTPPARVPAGAAPGAVEERAPNALQASRAGAPRLTLETPRVGSEAVARPGDAAGPVSASPTPEAAEMRAPDAPPSPRPGVPRPSLAPAAIGAENTATLSDSAPILLPAGAQSGLRARSRPASPIASSPDLVIDAPRPTPVALRSPVRAGIEIEAPVDETPPTSLPEATGRVADPRIEVGQRGAPLVRLASAPAPSPARTVALQPGVQVIQEALVAAFAAVPNAQPDRPVPSDPATTALAALVGAEAPRPQAVNAMGDAQQGALDMRRKEWTGQMVERIEAMRKAAPGGDTRIRLAPDMLGSVDVSIRQEGDRIHVHFAAETAAARQMLSEAQPRLAELAEARGLRLGQTSVDSGAAGQGSQGQRHDAAPRQPARPAPAATQSNLETDPGDQRIA